MNPKLVPPKPRPTSGGCTVVKKEYSSKVSCGSMSSAESVVSFSNSNIDVGSDEELGFSSDSDYEEHPYSVTKKIKLSDSDLYYPSTKSTSVTSRLTSYRPSSNLIDLEHNVAFSSKRKSRCNSRNAVLARMNRLKKKLFIEDLEARNKKLEEESKILKERLSSSLETVEKLKRETSNLRSVIKNSTDIGKLLRCIHTNTNLQISSSLLHSFEAEPDSTETLGHARKASKSSSDSVGAEAEEGNLPQEILDDNPLVNLNVGLSSFLSDSEIPCDQFVEPCLSPSLDLNYPELNPSLVMRCETPSNGITSNDTMDSLFEELGVCFHVANNKVSLEFCESCNFKASLANN